MDDTKIENLFHDAQRVSLTEDEKSVGREMLRSYMALTPIRGGVVKVKPVSRSFFAFAGLHRGAAVSSITLAVTLSMAGVSFAAEGALPGDTLYPVKVSVNEEVRAVLAPSAESKAKWEAERAERRLAEAEVLAEKGQLKAEARAIIEADFKKHAAKAQERVAKISERDNDDHVAVEVTAHLEGSLDAHKRIVAAIAKERRDQGSEDDAEVTELAASIDAQAQVMVVAAAEKRKANSDARAERTMERKRSAAETRRTAATKRIADVRTYLAGFREKLGAEATAQAEARVVAAEAVVAEGNVKFEAGEYDAASDAYVRAQRQAQEAKSLIRARGQLKVRVDLREDSARDNEREEEKRNEVEREEDEAERPRTERNTRRGEDDGGIIDARLELRIGR